MAKKRTVKRKTNAIPQLGRKPLSRMDLLTGRRAGEPIVRDPKKTYKAPKTTAADDANRIGAPTAGTFRRPKR